MSTSTDNRPRLWVISELYYPEETSTGYYLTRIAEGLADKFDVKVISGQPNYAARGTKAPRREIRKHVEIYRVSGTTWDKNVIAFRLINMATLSLSVLFRSIASFRSGDRVLVVTNPPSMPFVVALGSVVRGAVYSLLIHDNYPEILVAAGKVCPGSRFVSLMQRLNRWLYKNTSKIIVVGRDMSELVRRKTNGLETPVTFIPNWAELESVSPMSRDQNKLLGDLNLRDKFVLLYAGNMGPPNDIESIVAAAELLRKDDCFHFVFLGAGVKKVGLVNEVQDRGLSNVTVLDPKPRSEQIVFLNACDVALVSLVDKMLGVSVPSRTYNILAAGKPILALADEASEVARIVTEENVGWVVPPGDPRLLADTIRSIKARTADLTSMGRRARHAAEEKYSRAIAIKKYRDAVN